MDISVITSNLAMLPTLASALLNERDRQKAAAIQLDMTEKIIQTQAQLLEVLSTVVSKDATIQALTERNRQLQATQDERLRYKLTKVGVTGEAFAYRLRPAGELLERNDEPDHFLCQPCFDIGKKVVLRVEESMHIGRELVCGADGRHSVGLGYDSPGDQIATPGN